MRCEKFLGITTEEACLAQQRAKKILCQNCDQRLGAEVKTKHCPKCCEDKPVTDFSPDKKSRDHLRSYCKSCAPALAREYQQKKKGITGNPAPRVQRFQTKKEPSPTPSPKEPKLSTLKLTVDFTDYPELYDFVMHGPAQYLRTPENMILYGVALLLKEAK